MAASKYRITKYGKAQINMLGGEAGGDSFQIDYLTDTIKLLLTTSSHTPNLDTHETKSDITNEVSGGNYTAGGVALASKTAVYTAADSWGTARANSTVYAVGDIVRPATPNGFLYQCVVAGTSHSAPPTFGTVPMRETAEGGGTVIWVNVGKGISVLDSADPAFGSNVTATARHGHVYRDTGIASTSPLLYLVEFLDADGTTPADAIVTNSTLTVVLSALGIVNHFAIPGRAA